MPSTPERDRDHASRVPAASASVPDANLKRRRFLLALGAGTAGTAAVAAQAIAAPVTGGVRAAAREQGSGYRETEHVRDYYATARI